MNLATSLEKVSVSSLDTVFKVSLPFQAIAIYWTMSFFLPRFYRWPENALKEWKAFMEEKEKVSNEDSNPTSQDLNHVLRKSSMANHVLRKSSMALRMLNRQSSIFF